MYAMLQSVPVHPSGQEHVYNEALVASTFVQVPPFKQGRRFAQLFFHWQNFPVKADGQSHEKKSLATSGLLRYEIPVDEHVPPFMHGEGLLLQY